LGQCAFNEGAGFGVAFGAHRRGGKVGDGQVGDVIVERRAVGVEELAQLGVGGRVAAFCQRGDACGVPGSCDGSAVCCGIDLGEGTRRWRGSPDLGDGRSP
jgi:hypothetical protein